MPQSARRFSSTTMMECRRVGVFVYRFVVLGADDAGKAGFSKVGGAGGSTVPFGTGRGDSGLMI
jgi:hypothetical protein